MLKKERLLKMSSNFNVGIACNIVLGILYIFSKNSLREDFIIGICTTLLFILIFFSMKEFKAETLRQIRLRTKVIFRRQKLMLKYYSFFYIKIVVVLFIYCRKTLVRYIYIKLLYRVINLSGIKRFFFNKILFYKIYFINLLQIVFNKILIEVIKIKSNKNKLIRV